jgi:hypothetical protein
MFIIILLVVINHGQDPIVGRSILAIKHLELCYRIHALCN